MNDFGMAALCSQVTGFLFLENVKMEKQRTNASYRTIVPRFLKLNTFWTGLWPYGALQAYSKGLIFGMNQHLVRPYMERTQHSPLLTNLALGVSTGVSEALLTSPLMYARVHLNKHVSEQTLCAPIFSRDRLPSLSTLLGGSKVLMAKRVMDWTTRFTVIEEFKKRSPVSSDLFNTFCGAGLTAVFSSPIDRLLPVVYTSGNIRKVLQEQKWSFLYKGFVFRAISTAQYTTCVLFLPQYFPFIRRALGDIRWTRDDDGA